MKITQEIREVALAAEAGMAERAAAFREQGGEIYAPPAAG